MSFIDSRYLMFYQISLMEQSRCKRTMYTHLLSIQEIDRVQTYADKSGSSYLQITIKNPTKRIESHINRGLIIK